MTQTVCRIALKVSSTQQQSNCSRFGHKPSSDNHTNTTEIPANNINDEHANKLLPLLKLDTKGKVQLALAVAADQMKEKIAGLTEVSRLTSQVAKVTVRLEGSGTFK